MRFKKSKRFVALTIRFVVLLTLPIFIGIYLENFYYAGITFFIIAAIYRSIWNTKSEERFYEQWHKAKQKGFWKNVFRESLSTFVLITMLVSISQFFENGQTPLETVSKLSYTKIVGVFLWLFSFSLIIGINAWRENEKRYTRIHNSNKNE